MDEAEKEKTRIANSRLWETTNKAELHPMDLTVNTIGRRVMKTMDGKYVPPKKKKEANKEAGEEAKEEEEIKPTLKSGESEIDRKKLQEMLPKGHYTVTEPVTFYTQHLDRKNFYMSAATGPNPFAKSSGMTQIVNDTRAVRNYDGNVNFDRAKANVDTFLRSNALYQPGK
jgi:hypothetical protein